MKLFAPNWIWIEENSERQYNTVVTFRRVFSADSLKQAIIAITADSTYRLLVNGQRVGDGPCRHYPEESPLDEYDISQFLHSGENRVEVIVRFWGCSTFQRIPVHGGLAAQLELSCIDGTNQCIVTDEQWQAAQQRGYRRNVVKSASQMPPYEWMDARLDDLKFQPAIIVDASRMGTFTHRTVPFLKDTMVEAAAIQWVKTVLPEQRQFVLDPRQLFAPDDTSVEYNNFYPLLAAWELEADQDFDVKLTLLETTVSINGILCSSDSFCHFRKGRNFLLMGERRHDGHQTGCEILFSDFHHITVCQAWYVTFPEYSVIGIGQRQFWANRIYRQKVNAYWKLRDNAHSLVTQDEFLKKFPQARPLSQDQMLADPHVAFELSSPMETISSETSSWHSVTVHPRSGRDIELCIDFKKECVGYWMFEIDAAEGTIVDIAGIEYITEKHHIQHTGNDYRNSVRYICKDGCNQYTTLQRRGGRYLVMTLRNLTDVVIIHHVSIQESAYPIPKESFFQCDVPVWNRIWDLSLRTLQLCTEDTFVDCPLYEQTLWVGDARSESLFAMESIGGYAVIRRSLEIVAQSLKLQPLAASQAPSGWTTHIPIWSFIWVLNCQDYVDETGDLAFLMKIWPAIVKNLQNAIGRIAPENGLFTSGEWNFFDWCTTDTEHESMLLDSIFLYGALQSGIAMAEMLHDHSVREWCTEKSCALRQSILKFWNSEKMAWPDWAERDGTCSDSFAIHPLMAGFLFDLIPEMSLEHLKERFLKCPVDMTPVSSPFAAFYLYLCYAKMGCEVYIISAIKQDYSIMLDSGATTAWESFPSGTLSKGEFPTRSHCHGWSSAPLFFIQQLLVGLRKIPGTAGHSFAWSPCIQDVTEVSGSRPTSHGWITLSWHRRGETLKAEYTAPAEVTVYYEPNATTRGLSVTLTRLQ